MSRDKRTRKGRMKKNAQRRFERRSEAVAKEMDGGKFQMTPSQKHALGEFAFDFIGGLAGTVPHCGCIRCHASVPAHALDEHDCQNPTLGELLHSFVTKRRRQDLH